MRAGWQRETGRMQQAWRVVLLLCALVTPVGSLMFDLPSGKVKCFSEDLPAHTLVVSMSAPPALLA